MKEETLDIQQIWQDYGDRLRRFLVAKTASPEDAEDLLQEVLIKTYRHLPTLNDPKKFQAWLFQIARNTLTDYYRKRRVPVSDRSLPEPPALDGEDDHGKVRQELSRCLQPFLKRLPKNYREAVEAVDLKGQSQKALAEEWGLSHSAVKSRVQRGRKMLKELFHACCTYQMDARGNIITYEGNKNCC